MDPERIAHYQVVKKLGSGGMGEVYLAEDLKLHRRVAVKILSSQASESPERLRRFVREAHAASAVSHPHVAHIYEIGEDAGLHFIAMEYVEGEALDRRIAAGPLPTNEIIDIAIQIADALGEAHGRGVIHRDIKPSNIMITPRGQVKVLDFGLAKIDLRMETPEKGDTQLKTAPGTIMGTPYYMAPEQALGRDADPRTDLFSFGVVLYQMCTGRVPFAGATTAETLHRIVSAQPQPLARFNYELPVELERIVRKCLEKEPARRYQAARDVEIDLKNLQRDSTLQERERVGWSLTVSRFPRKTALGAALGGVLLLAIGFGYLRDRRGGPIDSLAVIPFESQPADPSFSYLADGLTETLTNRLSRLSSLRVIPTTTAFRYRNRSIDSQKIGDDLDVRAILTGRVVQRAGKFDIQAELIDTRSGAQIWGKQFSTSTSDLFGIQNDISQGVSTILGLRLTSLEERRLSERFTTSAEAYELYLKGRYYWNRRTGEGMRRAMDFFERAIEKDPRYALAYVGLADCYVTIGTRDAADPRLMFPRAKLAVAKALEIDDSLAEAHTTLGAIHGDYDWDSVAAESEFRTAISLNPKYATAHEWYALFLARRGRVREAVAEVSESEELDPFSVIIQTNAGLVLYLCRMDEKALEHARKAIRLGPDYYAGHVVAGLVLQQQGKLTEAIDSIAAAHRLSRGESTTVTASLAHAYAAANRTDEALNLLRQLETKKKNTFVSSADIALIYVGLARPDDALTWFERAYDEHSALLVYLKTEPRLAPIRNDIRLRALIAKIGL